MVDVAEGEPAFEGWFDDDYIIVFAEADVAKVSYQYRVSSYLPGFELIGLAGWDDLIVRDPNGGTYRVPSVPMLSEYLRPYSVPATIADLEQDERFIGKVKWYVQPLVFGGSPTDDQNTIWLRLDQHPELVVWWNERYRDIADGTREIE